MCIEQRNYVHCISPNDVIISTPPDIVCFYNREYCVQSKAFSFRLRKTDEIYPGVYTLLFSERKTLFFPEYFFPFLVATD